MKYNYPLYLSVVIFIVSSLWTFNKFDYEPLTVLIGSIIGIITTLHAKYEDKTSNLEKKGKRSKMLTISSTPKSVFVSAALVLFGGYAFFQFKSNKLIEENNEKQYLMELSYRRDIFKKHIEDISDQIKLIENDTIKIIRLMKQVSFTDTLINQYIIGIQERNFQLVNNSLKKLYKIQFDIQQQFNQYFDPSLGYAANPFVLVKNIFPGKIKILNTSRDSLHNLIWQDWARADYIRLNNLDTIFKNLNIDINSLEIHNVHEKKTNF